MPLPVYFAPLQGLTEDAYRRSHNEICGGIAEYYTPFLRMEHGEIRKKDNLGIRPEFNVKVPLVIQIIARDGEEMQQLLTGIHQQKKNWETKLAALQAQGCSDMGNFTTWANREKTLIDVNMGCPFPLQVDHGRGAGVLLCPEKVREICEVMKEHTECEFSVKMRLGVYDARDWKQVLPILNDSPLRHITLHPRIAKQMYKGNADREAFHSFATMCEKPLVYNGDLMSVEDILAVEQEFPSLAGVMIGRGLLARPTLAKEYQTGVSVTQSELTSSFIRMHESLYRYYSGTIPGDEQLLRKMQAFWEYAEPTFGRKAIKKIVKAGNMRNYLKAVDGLV